MLKKLFIILSALFVLEASSQVYTWAAMDSLYSEGGIDLAKDDFGNVFVASVYDDNINLCKYDPGYHLEWERKIYSLGISDLAVGICCDHIGNVYATACFTGDLKLDTTTLLSLYGGNMFLMKLDPAGIFQWVKHTSGSQTRGRKLSCDALNNIY
ncbi:MAG: hypothetical protein ACJ76F_01435, partial [Bacteroidia bacterium]